MLDNACLRLRPVAFAEFPGVQPGGVRQSQRIIRIGEHDLHMRFEQSVDSLVLPVVKDFPECTGLKLRLVGRRVRHFGRSGGCRQPGAARKADCGECGEGDDQSHDRFSMGWADAAKVD